MTTDPTYLSLDDIIRLNREKNGGSGSVKSFASNRSYKSNHSRHSCKSVRSNHSHRSYGGMSTHSNRSRGNFRRRRGYYNHNGTSPMFRNRVPGHRMVYRSNNYTNYRRNLLINRNRYNGYGRQRLARNRVNYAIKYLNRPFQQNYFHRYKPHQNGWHVPMKRTTLGLNYTNRKRKQQADVSDRASITVSVKNNDTRRTGLHRRMQQGSGLTIQRLAQFDRMNTSPLRRNLNSFSNLSRTAGIESTQLIRPVNPQISAAIESYMDVARNEIEFDEISQDYLNNLTVSVATTSLTCTERFRFYMMYGQAPHTS